MVMFPRDQYSYIVASWTIQRASSASKPSRICNLRVTGILEGILTPRHPAAQSRNIHCLFLHLLSLFIPLL